MFNRKKTNYSLFLSFLSFLFILLIFSSCNDGMFSSEVNAGVTPGGSQDNGHARELIENGIVPRSEAFTYEGAFSEHDFFITNNSNCENEICIETVLSEYSPIIKESSEKRYIAQLIMSSNIDATNFKHSAIDLFIVLDKSGSMRGDRFEKSKEAIKSIIKKLNPEDSLGLITFDDSFNTERALSPVGNNIESILSKVDSFKIGGSTDIESALKSAYQQLNSDGKKNNKRIILLTDARPNVNAEGKGEFLNLIKQYENEIGLTVFGVGIDFGQTLTKAISETTGGNYIFLPQISDIDERLNNEFEFLISPIANNFNLKIKSGENFKVLNSYGLPNNNTDEVTLNAKTLFLSKSKGAIAIEFEYNNPDSDIIIPMNNEKVFSFEYSFENLNKVKFEKSENTFFSPFSTTSGNYSYTVSGSEKLPFLVNMITVLKEVCDLYSEDKYQEAVTLLDKLLTDLNEVNLVLEDDQITREKDMIEKLKVIISKQL